MPDYGPPEIDEVFPAARAAFEELLADLFDHQGVCHAEAEEFIAARGREVHRLMLQEWFTQHAQREERLPQVAGSDQVVRRAAEADHKRLLSTRFGTVEVERIAYRAKGASNLHPADAELDLPVGRHSHALKKLAAIEAARGSFEAAAAAIERATGTHLGKRQVEQLVQRAAADVDDFYAHTRSSGSGSGSEEMLLVLSADGKGIVMRPEALREETRRAAAKKAASGGGPFQTRLAGGEKNGRKRMATVGAVYDLAPVPRRPGDVIRGGDNTDRTGRPERPRAQAKWLTASVERDADQVISTVFDEAERRDPDRKREWVMLVDGARHQLDVIHDQCDARGAEVRILIDFVHVLEYAWGAAWCFFARTDPAAEAWVGEIALEIPQGRAEQIADALEARADAEDLDGQRRFEVDKAVGYLRAKLPYLGYDIALAEGWPIATGVIEGACRHLVKDRMDITGARWGLAGAEAVLKLRAVISNGDFEEYWEYHTQREHLRVHAVRYRDGLALAA